MKRILLAILITMSLAFAPKAAPAAHPVDCPMMQEAGGAVPQHHDKDCCTDACAVTAAAAVLPASDAGACAFQPASAFPAAPPNASPESFDPAGDDPPPRTFRI